MTYTTKLIQQFLLLLKQPKTVISISIINNLKWIDSRNKLPIIWFDIAFFCDNRTCALVQSISTYKTEIKFELLTGYLNLRKNKIFIYVFLCSFFDKLE